MEWVVVDLETFYLTSEVADEVYQMVDKAGQFFDSLKIRGKSKSVKTEAGRPKIVEVNLLSHRLHMVDDLPRDSCQSEYALRGRAPAPPAPP
jgi:hypothetical protein